MTVLAGHERKHSTYRADHDHHIILEDVSVVVSISEDML